MLLLKPSEIVGTIQILMERPDAVVTNFRNKIALGSVSISDTEEFLQALKALKTFKKESRRYWAISNY